MKKIIVILIATAAINSSKAQQGPPLGAGQGLSDLKTEEKRNPVKPYNENGYPVEHVKACARFDKKSNGQLVDPDPIWKEWVKNLIIIVNDGLKKANVTGNDSKILTVNESNTDWILNQTYDSLVELENYQNSGRGVGIEVNKMDFFVDKGKFKGNVRVFHYGDCIILLYKPICVNLLGMQVQNTKPTPQDNPNISTFAVRRADGTMYISIQNINIASVSNSGNSSSTSTNNNDNAAVNSTPSYQKPDYVTPVLYFLGSLVRGLSGGGGGGNYIEPRTGGYGVSGTPNGNNGVPGDTRTGGFGVDRY